MEGKDRQGTEYYLSLKRKIILLVLIVSFTPLILISGTILYQFRVSYQEKVRAHLEEVVKKHAQTIDTFLDDGNLRL
jgi:two-component system NtrC family sensor kinase